MKNSLNIEDPDIKKKIVKYLLFGFIVGLSVRYVPKNTINNKEIIMIGAIASISFGIIDIISPSVVVK
jgi:hypothetical protein